LRHSLLTAALAWAAAMPWVASAADAVNFSATLTGAAEVPPNTSPGSGSLEATLDKSTSELTWKMTFIGLTGPATMAHFHGPAMPGANAGVVVKFASAVSPLEGKATLSTEQVADLMAGKWYANVHTTANPGGEIRGQLMTK
jgi:hypothetical protein